MKFQASALSIAIVAATGLMGPANAAEPKAVGALPTYPDCSAMTGAAKDNCMKAAKQETGGVENPVTGGKRAQGAAPKYPKQMTADSGSANTTSAETSVRAKGVAPKYPTVVEDHRSGGTDAKAAGGMSMTAAGGAGEPGVKGVAPKFPGKPDMAEGKNAEAAPDKVKVKGAAPKYPKMDEAKDATASSLEPKSSIKSKGVAPKYPKSE